MYNVYFPDIYVHALLAAISIFSSKNGLTMKLSQNL